MRKIIVLISIFILVTLGIELISMRIYEETYYDKITKVLIPDDSLIWKTKPNINTIFESAHLTTNSLGFRNDEIGEKTKKRIIIMGPSSSFGWGVEREKTFPFLLSQKLKNYEIINASVIGYSSYQGKILFETIIKKLSPDIIIFAYGVNDPDKYRFFKNYDLSDEKIIKRQSQINFLFDKISKSYFLRLISSYFIKKNILKLKPHLNKRVELDEYLNNIKYFEKETKNNKAKLILLTSPFLKPQLNIDKYLNKTNFVNKRKSELFLIYQEIIKYNNVMKLYAKNNRIICIDLFSIFANNKKLFLNPNFDMVHFSEIGHSLISNILYRYISKYET